MVDRVWRMWEYQSSKETNRNKQMTFTIGQQIKDKTTGKMYTVKRVNKNGTLRVTFWDRYERQIECTARAEEFEAK